MTVPPPRRHVCLPARLAAWAIAAACSGLPQAASAEDDARLAFLLDRVLERAPAARAEVINGAINQFEHRESPGPSRWQSPQQLVQLGAGDCKDFALAKYWLLRYSGTPRERARFGYGEVLLQGQWQRHLVVLVWADTGSPLVLDNLAQGVFRLNDRHDLRISFSFDEQAFYDETSDRRIRDQPLRGWQGLWESLPRPAPLKTAARR